MKGAVYCSGAGIICWGMTGGAFGIPFWWVPVVLGLLIVGAASVAEHLAAMPTTPADDCGYSDTPQGQDAIEQADDFRQWACEMAKFDQRAVWPNEAGAPE